VLLPTFGLPTKTITGFVMTFFPELFSVVTW